MNISLEEAVKIIEKGGIIIFPTDTAFGIGCRIDSEQATERLFEIRKRPKDKAVPVLFESIERVKEYALPFDQEVENLMNKYWPGALTIVLKCKVYKVPNLARGGKDTLGVRIPNYKPLIELIKKVGVPIIGTSANFAGKPTPFTIDELDQGLVKQVDGVLQGVSLQKGNKQTSTVVDCTSKLWKILRQGSVKPDVQSYFTSGVKYVDTSGNKH